MRWRTRRCFCFCFCFVSRLLFLFFTLPLPRDTQISAGTRKHRGNVMTRHHPNVKWQKKGEAHTKKENTSMTATLVTFKVTHGGRWSGDRDSTGRSACGRPSHGKRVVSRRTTDASLPRSANKTPSKYHADMKSITKVLETPKTRQNDVQKWGLKLSQPPQFKGWQYSFQSILITSPLLKITLESSEAFQQEKLHVWLQCHIIFYTTPSYPVCFFSLKKCTITQELLQLSIDVVPTPIQFKKKHTHTKKLACSWKGCDSCSHGFL